MDVEMGLYGKRMGSGGEAGQENIIGDKYYKGYIICMQKSLNETQYFVQVV